MRAKKCLVCDKLLRLQNKSNLCSHHNKLKTQNNKRNK